MLQWIRSYYKASGQMKLFILNWALYMIILVATTVYVYGRLDYVRSGPKGNQTKEQTIMKE